MQYKILADTRDIPAIGPIIENFKDEARYYEDFDLADPYTRIAGNLRDGIDYFLANAYRQVVSVRNGSWSICSSSSHKFLSSSSHRAQVTPIRNNEDIFSLLGSCVNLAGDDLTLFVIWMIQNYSGGSHYGLMLSAERGSGKSSLTRTANLLIDPSPADATIMQAKLDDFQTFLANHYLACFDNVRRIPTDYSDTLCTAITGGVVSKRKLYSDRDAVYLRLLNSVIINGINVFPEESDLAERFLYFHLKKITPDRLKPDFFLENHLRQNRPLILGRIFDVLAKATTIAPNLTPKNPTRMAGSYTEMLAIAIALGLSESTFHSLISKNIARLHQACAASPLVEAICEYMNGPMAGKRKITETSTALFTNVRKNYSGKKSALGPRAAEFSKRLKAEHDALFAAGFASIIDDTQSTSSVITIIREKY